MSTLLAGLVLASSFAPKPKLVLLVSIDQFRADYVDRFSEHYLPARAGGRIGGFRFLTETGAHFTDAHHNHVPTATGPGHATLMTGSEPFLDGIAGNEWFDRSTGKSVYVVDDPNVTTIGGTSGPMSPKNLKVTTVGDELKMATNGKSKVVGIALKDRAAILMAGHAADTVIWFDPGTGNWVTSSFYASKLPVWVDQLNGEKIPFQSSGKDWKPLLSADAYSKTRPAPFAKTTDPMFSHKLPEVSAPAKNAFTAFASSSFGQEYVFKTVERAIDSEQLGQSGNTDVLVVNLSTNDYVGHAYGPNSPEVLDISIRTDRLLSELFQKIDAKVGIDNVDIVLTADHGVVPIVEESNDVYKTGVQRVLDATIVKAVRTALVEKFGEGDWILGNGMYEMNFYLNRATIAAKKLKARDVEEAAAEAAKTVPGVYVAFTKTQIEHGELPAWTWTSLVSNGYYPALSGDLMVFLAPGNYAGGGTGTGHGEPWKYDSHVPILFRGPGVRSGRFARSVTTADIAPTLCNILGIEYPTGCVGHPLFELLDRSGK